jgi:hypothetical protein
MDPVLPVDKIYRVEQYHHQRMMQLIENTGFALQAAASARTDFPAGCAKFRIRAVKNFRNR